ncbi:glutaminyl-peptide cyclotransferase [bacterium]|nr:glutaminyl-peptide cyclotransferase [bacterium]
MNHWTRFVALTVFLGLGMIIYPAMLRAQSGIPGTFRGAPVYTYDVINSYPHDTTAYTQGLLIHDGVMYESTGQFNESTLRSVDIETGEVLKQVEVSKDQFAEGITLFNGQIIQLTWRAGIAHVYDAETFERVGEFRYQGEGWGLTHDGTQLIMSNGTDEIDFRDPKTFRITHTLPVWDAVGGVRGLNELEYIDGFIYANVIPSDLIAKIDPETGEVVAWMYLEGLLDVNTIRRPDVLNGIAINHDTGQIYLTGKLWPRLYEVEFIEVN